MFRKLIDSPWLYFTLAALVVVVGIGLQFKRISVDTPEGTAAEIRGIAERDDVNVLFILIDTLRADRLHGYGYKRNTSPNIDALIARGIRFDRVEGQSSWTKASMASLWTGFYPQRTGVLRFSHAIPDAATMPAEVFQQAGIRTAGVWRNGWVANNFGFDQGFDLYYRPTKNRPVQNIQRHNPSATRLQGTDADATESAMEFIVNNSGERFLLYVHYMDVHQYLYADTSPNFGTSFSDFYDSAIHWTDRNVGSLIEGLRAQGILDNTVIVIASDHGEEFYEHGSEGHAKDLYSTVQHVPLIIALPFALDQPIVVEQAVANVDIWPTVLDLVGLPPLPDTDGRSLVPLIEAAAGLAPAPDDLTNRVLYSQIDKNWGRTSRDPDPLVAVISENQRMVHRSSTPGRVELFDWTEDPNEQKNIASEHPERVAELTALVQAHLEQSNSQWGETPEIELDDMKKAQLRALGYVVTEAEKREKIGAAQRRKAEIQRRNE